MAYKITDTQNETLNAWLQDAYNAGFKDGQDGLHDAYNTGFKEGYEAGLKNSEASDRPNENIYPVYNCIPDISSFQPTPDYDKLCASSDFIILRGRYCSKTDPRFAERAAELVKRNMPFAVYDYVTLMSAANAKQQAELMYELCSPFNPRVYYIDTEQLGTGVRRGEEMEYIKIYVARLRELGVKTIGQYTGDWLYSTYYYKLQDLFDTLWIASYGQNTGLYTGVKLKAAEYTDKIDLHQYTDKGVLPGINARGDLSRLTGNKPLEWFTGRKYS